MEIKNKKNCLQVDICKRLNVISDIITVHTSEQKWHIYTVRNDENVQTCMTVKREDKTLFIVAAIIKFEKITHFHIKISPTAALKLPRLKSYFPCVAQ